MVGLVLREGAVEGFDGVKVVRGVVGHVLGVAVGVNEAGEAGTVEGIRVME